MNYFATFPTKSYDIEKNKKYRTVTDLGRRVGIRSDMVNILPAYYKSSVISSSRPELVSDNIYDDVNYHWILMQLNNVVDPYYDWIMEDATFDEFLERKYPNKNLLLDTDHHSAPSYNTTDPKKYFFYPGETIWTGSKLAEATATGTVVEFDPTMKQVVYKPVTGTFVGRVGQTDGNVINGTVSGAMGRVADYSTEVNGIHHYESTAPEESGLIVAQDYVTVYGTVYYYSAPVTNLTYEIDRNEGNREISVLSSNYVQQFVSEFKEKVKG